VTGPSWRVRLSAAAERDFFDILAWTAQRFGGPRAAAYKALLTEAVAALAAGPGAHGVKRRSDIGLDLYTLHVRRKSRPGRHLILFRAKGGTAAPAIEVLRILHDAMDLSRHVPPPEAER